MSSAMDQNGGNAKKGVGALGSDASASNTFLREKMESTLKKAREKVAEVQQDVDSNRFDKAWERVYGNKQYRPSWIGKLQNRGAPPKTRQPHGRAKKQEPISEEKKEEDEFFANQKEGIPEQYRAKKALEPLKIKGKIVPNEKALDKWRKEIDTGEATNNKVVKSTNVVGWIDNNQYWKQDAEFSGMKLARKKDGQRPPAEQKINTEKYDMIGKYENRVRKDDLKIGDAALPKERDLKKWGDELEIPDNIIIGASSSSSSSTSSSKKATASSASAAESEGQKKWNKVLKTADVPTFLANGYW